ncbi:uncharacterized protein F5891DRAFT_986188 [Suillus fuscotomentosus]|uniref:Uncharacterized protein n=1 Tax=Suillus fuscotomentosus TaxID=1912939 RepID=A0AAD4DSU1_9AGAM|nr:uncharacterized protein F5891DRAFT_986188 [Suillus fuscotomentosus]KAG1893122.1 hypothetical protein F5891DRAFT_986188 [Suillus fuscotomentosus]
MRRPPHQLRLLLHLLRCLLSCLLRFLLPRLLPRQSQLKQRYELLAWSKTADGSNEITRMCSALVTIRKNIQALTRSAVLWGYNLHQLLHTEKEVNGKDVNIPFGSRAMQHYIHQLLYHDRQYKHFIENKRNIQPLYTYTSVLFKWALTEMSSGVFRELDFKIAEAIKDHDTMVKLFKTLTREQLDALTANILD